MAEMSKALRTKLGRTVSEVEYRRKQMNIAFPEAIVSVPPELLRTVECIPDKDDRHVLAAAVMARANAIITQNTRHFPKECINKYGVLCQTADDFLVHQYHLSEQLVLDKLDDQGAGISQDRAFVISSLRNSVPGFVKLVETQ